MLLLNLSHPLTTDQLATVQRLCGSEPELRSLTHHMLPDETPTGVAQQLIDRFGLSSEEWQTRQLLINLPGHAALAAAVLAELHGRCGYFPTVLVIRQRPGSVPPQFDVTELLNLQEQRDSARRRR